jgi:hypothetical protein
MMSIVAALAGKKRETSGVQVVGCREVEVAI